MSEESIADLKFRPLGDRVIVKIILESEITEGGLFVPTSAREKSQKGIVLAIGTGKVGNDGKREPLEVKPGDIILYARHSGEELRLNGIDCLLVTSRDIIGIVEPVGLIK